MPKTTTMAHTTTAPLESSVAGARPRQPGSRGVPLGALVVLIGTVLPRLALLGGRPASDEGVYASLAQIINASLDQGAGLPDTGWLAIYPLLVHWIFELPGNHLILLRLIDLGVAAVASWLFYLILARESRDRLAGAVLAVVFLLVMNHPTFINSGFKNSIFLSFIPLFLAVLTWQGQRLPEWAKWSLAGALTGLAVVLREPFLLILLAAAISILLGHGRAAFLWFSGAATGTAIILISVILGWRPGGIASLMATYQATARGLSPPLSERLAMIAMGASAAIQHAWAPILLGLVGGLALFARGLAQGFRSLGLRPLFWLAVVAAPLAEPALKSGYPYHFANSLPGIAGLCALAWATVIAPQSATARMGTLGASAVVAGVLLLPDLAGLRYSAQYTVDALRAFPSGRWPAERASRSNYLLAAQRITENAPPGARLTLLKPDRGGMGLALFPLTGLLPPAPELRIIAYDPSTGTPQPPLKTMLGPCPPEIVVVWVEADTNGADALAAALADTGLYRKVADVPQRPGTDYGVLSGFIYRLSGEQDPACRR